MMESLKKLSLVIYVVTIALGLPFNIFALYVFYKRSRVRMTPNLIYMINLCSSDLVFILFLPIKIIETSTNQWTLPAILCPIYNFFHFSTIYASACFLTAVSIGRYLGAAFPITYQMYKKPRYSFFICLALWALVIFHVALVFFIEIGLNANANFFLSTTVNGTECYDNFSEEQLKVVVPVRLELSIVLFFLPLAITTFCYAHCLRILMRSQMHASKKKRAIRVAITTMALFIVCFAPYNISHVIGFAIQDNVWWRREALLPSTCNAFLDPLIFYSLSSAADKGFLHFCKSLQKKYGPMQQNLSAAWVKAEEKKKPLTISTIV
ncbi:free fatty acid receptor 2-like [Rhinatrema bivittatum]|uniref:free fatty acid receptor 2-like n=1 Tax=Rhinatrema bivittatum TaxID=194408 RepID=UPI00112E184E|nr:free fatty acid receptor 2-like [Rhinatrema bivittatum]